MADQLRLGGYPSLLPLTTCSKSPTHRLACQLPSPCLQVERVLATSYDWQFDAFQLAVATGDHALSTLGFYLFNAADLIKQFALRPVPLVR